MTPEQEYALLHPIDTQEDLQKAWDTPRRFRHSLSDKHMVLLNLCVVIDNGKWVWMAAVRTLHTKKGKLKPVASFLQVERLNAQMTLEQELLGVGKGVRSSWNTQYAAHMQDELTEEEVAMIPPKDDDTFAQCIEVEHISGRRCSLDASHEGDHRMGPVPQPPPEIPEPEKTNGQAPGVITNKNDAAKLLDKLESDLERDKDRRIILPGE
jgi:hypothetical protein